MKIKDIPLIALFIAFVTICAYITVPSPIPFTMQTFGVFLTLVALGGRRGTLAVFLYLLMGALSLPVFSGFQGGLSYLFGLTGGFLFGFLLASLFFWLLTRLLGNSFSVTLFAAVGGLLLVYLCGALWFYFVYSAKGGAGLGFVLLSTVLPYLLPDALKLSLALGIGLKVRQRIGRE